MPAPGQRGETLSDPGSASRTPDTESTHLQDSAALDAQSRAPLSAEEPGRYELIRELGRGGQGVVHLAYDRHLGRQIAFKHLLPSRRESTTPDALSGPEARFVREARVTAQLDHAGIAPIHEVGRRADGSLYATQKLLRGRTMAAALEACSSLPERLALLPPLLGACQAVAFAHSRGVIHRDLKPANIMLGAPGEAVVLDWGLARTAHDEPSAAAAAAEPVTSLLESDIARTREGVVMGTPAYMSPEQAVGAGADVDARADVWGLGVILYEMLAGRRPFVGRSSSEVLRAVATEPLPQLRVACPEVPPELAAVAEKALARDRAGRYPSAKELADELAAWLSGGRVVAHDYSSLELARRFIKRNRTLTASVLIALAGLTAGAVTTYGQLLSARRGLAAAFTEKGKQALSNRDFASAAVHFAAARTYEETGAHRWQLARALTSVPAVEVERHGPPWSASAVAFLPDGRPITIARGPAGGTARDLASGAALWEAPFDEPILSEQVQGGGRYLVVTGKSRVAVVDVASGKRLAAGSGRPGSWGIRVCRRADGKFMAADLLRLPTPPMARQKYGVWLGELGGEGGDLPLPDVYEGLSTTFTPDCSALVVGGPPVPQVWDVAKHSRLSTPAFPRSGPLGFLGDGTFAGFASAAVQIYSWPQLEVLRSIPSKQGWGTIATSSGSRFAYESGNVIELSDGRLPMVLARLLVQGPTADQALSPDGRKLAASFGPQASTAFVWSLPDLTEIPLRMSMLRYTADGRRAAFITLDSSRQEAGVAVADLRSGAVLFRAPLGKVNATDVHSLVITGDGSRVSASSLGGPAMVWNVATGSRIAALGVSSGHQALSDDGRLLALTSRNLSVWDVDAGKELWNEPVAEDADVEASFSRDGARLAVGTRKGSLSLREARTGKLIQELPSGAPIFGVGLSPDGRSLAVMREASLALHSISTGNLLWKVAARARHGEAFDWGLDGTWLATRATPGVRSIADGSSLLDDFFAPSPDFGFYVAGVDGIVYVRPAVRPADLLPPEAALASALRTTRLRLDGLDVSARPIPEPAPRAQIGDAEAR